MQSEQEITVYVLYVSEGTGLFCSGEPLRPQSLSERWYLHKEGFCWVLMQLHRQV